MFDRHRQMPAPDRTRSQVLREGYRLFLDAEKIERSLHAADRFAIKAHADGQDLGLTERQIIIMLEGKLPFGYD